MDGLMTSVRLQCNVKKKSNNVSLPGKTVHLSLTWLTINYEMDNYFLANELQLHCNI